MTARPGDIAVEIDGVPRTARLTLGALAEIETAISVEGVAELAARMRQARAADLVAVAAAALRAGGEAAPADLAAKLSPGQAAALVGALFEQAAP